MNLPPGRHVIFPGLGRRPDGSIGLVWALAAITSADWPYPRVQPLAPPTQPHDPVAGVLVVDGQAVEEHGYPIRSEQATIALLQHYFHCTRSFARGIIARAVMFGALIPHFEGNSPYLIPTAAWYHWLGKALAGERRNGRRRPKGGAR